MLELPECRTATPGRLAQLENELFKVSDGACDLPMVMAVMISSVQGQRQVWETKN